MKRQIKMGDILLCRINIELLGATEKIFVSGKTYLAVDNNGLLDEQGLKRYGWNQDIIDSHFEILSRNAS